MEVRRRIIGVRNTGDKEMKSKILTLVLMLGVSSTAFSAGLGEVIRADIANKPGYRLLTITNGCKSGKTKNTGERRSCSESLRITVPDGYRLLGQTVDVTTIANKGTGSGCSGSTPELGYDDEGNPIIIAVSSSANARSEKGGNTWVTGTLGSITSLGGAIGAAATELFNELGTRGAVMCKLSITARKK